MPQIPHRHTHRAKAKPTAAMLLPPSEPALRCLCTTQALEPCAGKSSWGRASNPQEDCPHLMERGCGTYSSTTTSTPLSETRTVGHLLPQFTPDVTAGWAASPVGHQATRFSFTQLGRLEQCK